MCRGESAIWLAGMTALPPTHGAWPPPHLSVHGIKQRHTRPRMTAARSADDLNQMPIAVMARHSDRATRGSGWRAMTRESANDMEKERNYPVINLRVGLV